MIGLNAPRSHWDHQGRSISPLPATTVVPHRAASTAGTAHLGERVLSADGRSQRRTLVRWTFEKLSSLCLLLSLLLSPLFVVLVITLCSPLSLSLLLLSLRVVNTSGHQGQQDEECRVTCLGPLASPYSHTPCCPSGAPYPLENIHRELQLRFLIPRGSLICWYNQQVKSWKSMVSGKSYSRLYH
jgi:hypothetical protein